MNGRHQGGSAAGRCCDHIAQDAPRGQRGGRAWRRGGEAAVLKRGGETAAWIISSATLVLLPKCPACIAMYLALFSGVGISMAGAAGLRMALIVLCVSSLLCLALLRLRRVAAGRARP